MIFNPTSTIELFFSAEELLSKKYDSIEINPVKLHIDANGDEFFEQCEENENPFCYSVYGRTEAEGLECIADCGNLESAQAFKDLLDIYLINIG